MPTDPAGHLVLWLVTRPEHRSASHPSETLGQSAFRRLPQAGSKVDLFRDLQRVVHFDAEIPDSAL